MPSKLSRQNQHEFDSDDSNVDYGSGSDDQSDHRGDAILGELFHSTSSSPAPSSSRPRANRVRQRDDSPKRVRAALDKTQVISVSSDASESGDDSEPQQPERRVVQQRPKPRGRRAAPKRASGPKSKQWTYTINNPSATVRQRLQALHLIASTPVEYHVFQYEDAPTTHTLHIQGYICFSIRKCRSTVQDLLGDKTCHLEVTRGSPSENREYCSAQEKRHADYRDFLFECGTLPTTHNLAGPKDEMLAAKLLLESGQTPDIMARDNGMFANVARHHKFYDRYYNSLAEPRSSRPYVFVFWGATGMGKTFAAEQFKNAYFVPTGSSGTTWFDGFDPRNHKVVVFNEMHGSRMQLSSLLELMDKHAMEVNRKGSYVKFNPACIVFTSNLAPSNWYSWNDPEKHLAHPYEALERRFQSVWEYVEPDSVPGLREAATRVIGDKALLGVAQCTKGRNDYHPCVDKGIYKSFQFMDTSYWAIPKDDEVADHSVEEIPDMW